MDEKLLREQQNSQTTNDKGIVSRKLLDFGYNNGEAWRAVEGFGGRYIISSFGRLFSLYRTFGNKSNYIIRNEIKEICPVLDDRKNHYRFNLNTPLKENSSIGACQLVARYFLPKPHGKKKYHRLFFKDGDQSNLRADNLAYFCKFKNKKDYVAHLRNVALDKKKAIGVTNKIVDYLEGDKKAIEDIIMCHEKKLYWAIYKVTNSHTFIDDILQETLVQICRAIDNWMFAFPENPIGWFIVIAKNTARNYMAKECRNKTINPVLNKDDNITMVDTL